MNMKFGIRMAAIVAAVFSGSAVLADTYALCIGINDYPDVVDSNGKPLTDDKGNPINSDLKGCVNDANSMKALLMKHYNVPAANIRTLLNSEANEANFVAQMKWLISSAKPGDQIVFSYSGHGGQVKSEKAEEGDKLDEVIVLADNKLVPDDLFGEIARMMADNGRHATMIFDSCFSGGMARPWPEGVVPRQKFIDPKLISRSASFKEVSPRTIQQVRTAVPKLKGQATGSYAFVFAGQEDQPTIDISGLKDIPDHGVFTLFLEAATEDNPRMSIEELVASTKKYLTELKFEQKPTAEFSSEERAQKPLILN